MLLSTFGLAIVLLLSPCKVRNAVEAALGIPQTEVLNKIKTAVSGTACQTAETSAFAIASSGFVVQNIAAVALQKTNFKWIDVDFGNRTTSACANRSYDPYFFPLYLLYLNFKVYL